MNVLRGLVEAAAVAGATTAVEQDANVALWAGLTYGGLLAIVRAIATIVREVRKARERREGKVR